MRKAIADADRPLSALASFLRTARIAELSSFGRIAEDRLKVLDSLEFLKSAEDTDENNLQELIANATWLINPEWAPVTANRDHFPVFARSSRNIIKNEWDNPSHSAASKTRGDVQILFFQARKALFRLSKSRNPIMH